MRQEHKDEIKAIIQRMLKIGELADKFPFLEKSIMKNRLVDGPCINFGTSYKNLYLPWGINRYFYDSKKTRITNFKGTHEGYLFNVYVNTVSMYDSHDKFGLESLAEHVFYLDDINSTFYCTDGQIENFLERLNDWYLSAVEKVKKVETDSRISRLEKELNDLKEQK